MMHLTQSRSAVTQRVDVPSTLRETWLNHSPCLSYSERQALEAVAVPAKRVQPHTDLLREGKRADHLFVITEGWACRYVMSRDGCRQLSALLLPGDIVNLDALSLTWQAYGVRMLTQASVVALPREQVLMLSAQHSGIAQTLLRTSLIENGTLSKWALCLGRLSAKERLAHLICELAVRIRAVDGKSVSFDFPLTQETLADALGLTPVHVNRMVRELRAEGLVEDAHRTITLPDVAALRRMASFDASYLHVNVHTSRVSN